MGVVVSKDLKGKRETEKALERTKKDFNKGKDVYAELDRVWRMIKDRAYANCPKRRGFLANTIRVTSMPVGAMTGSWSRVKAIQVFNKTIIAGDITKGVDYATWVHDGHKIKGTSNKRVEGMPFLTEAIAAYDTELNDAIQRALKKLGKKFQGY